MLGSKATEKVRVSRGHAGLLKVLCDILSSLSVPFPEEPRESHDFESWGSFLLGHGEDLELFMQHNLVKRIESQSLNF